MNSLIAIFANKGLEEELKNALSHVLTPLEPFSVLFNNNDFEKQNIRIGLCDGENTKALQFFANLQIPVITCSMNPLDSITLSSQQNGFCFVSVQRSFPRCNGTLLEVADYPVVLNSSFSPFTVLAVAAVSLLNDGKLQTI